MQLFFMHCMEMNGVSNPIKIYLGALMIAIKVSVAMCRLPIREFSSFGKNVYLVLKQQTTNQ